MKITKNNVKILVSGDSLVIEMAVNRLDEFDS
jgi:hypothetical protein